MDAKPILTPLAALLRSRKFLIALTVVIIAALVHFVPTLAPVQDQLGYVVLLALFLIAGITVEDSAEKWAARPGTTKDALRDLLTEALEEFFSEDEPTQPGGAG